jgi:hypothetical protein
MVLFQGALAMKRKYFLMGILLALALHFSQAATAQILLNDLQMITDRRYQTGKIQLNNLTVLPRLALTGIYDDNIYLGSGSNSLEEEKVSDWINRIRPALFINYALPARGRLNIGYEGDFAFYIDDNENNWQTHKILADFTYKAPGGLFAKLTNMFADAEDPYSSPTEYRLGIPNVKRWVNNLKTRIGWDFKDRFKLLAFFNYYYQDYDNEEDFTQDHKDPEGGMGAEMRLMPRTWGFLRYHFGSRDYYSHPMGIKSTETNDADFDWHRVNMGLAWDATAKLKGELNFGYAWKMYQNEFDSGGRPYEDLNDWIANTKIIYEPMPQTTLILDIRRLPRQTFSNTNEQYVETSAGLAFHQTLYTNAGVGAYAEYSHMDFNVPSGNSRADDNIRWGAELYYWVQEWLNTGLGYTYWKKDSNIEQFSYTDNRLSLFFRMVY